MGDTINKINVIPDEAIKEITGKIYDDVAHLPAKQVGYSLEGLMKFVALPFKFLGMSADELGKRMERFLMTAAEKVPDDNRVMPKPAIACPLLEHVKYCFAEEDPTLEEMFANLLAAAMDDRTKDKVHPRYVSALNQFSPEDALNMKTLELLPGISEFILGESSVCTPVRVLCETMAVRAYGSENIDPREIIETMIVYSGVVSNSDPDTVSRLIYNRSSFGFTLRLLENFGFLSMKNKFYRNPDETWDESNSSNTSSSDEIKSGVQIVSGFYADYLRDNFSGEGGGVEPYSALTILSYTTDGSEFLRLCFPRRDEIKLSQGEA